MKCLLSIEKYSSHIYQMTTESSFWQRLIQNFSRVNTIYNKKYLLEFHRILSFSKATWSNKIIYFPQLINLWSIEKMYLNWLKKFFGVCFRNFPKKRSRIFDIKYYSNFINAKKNSSQSNKLNIKKKR